MVVRIRVKIKQAMEELNIHLSVSLKKNAVSIFFCEYIIDIIKKRRYY